MAVTEQQLKALVAECQQLQNQRTELNNEIHKLTGRQESAQKEKAEIDATCRTLGFEPDKLDQVIEKAFAQVTEQKEQLRVKLSEHLAQVRVIKSNMEAS